jgi:hypothetical protein
MSRGTRDGAGKYILPDIGPNTAQVRKKDHFVTDI